MPKQSDTVLSITQDTDSKRWAKVFLANVVHEGQNIDFETMESWFANAIMSGYDKGVQRERRRAERLADAYEHVKKCGCDGCVGFLRDKFSEWRLENEKN